MHDRPETLDALQVALDVDRPDGAEVAAWRDRYVDANDGAQPLVNLCVEYLHERRLCYSCGGPADRLVLGEFPWVCASCDTDG